MTKGELVTGSLLVLIFVACMAAVLSDFGTRVGLTSAAFPPDSTVAAIIGWALTLLSAYALLLGVLVSTGRLRRFFPDADARIFPWLPIPWFYTFALAPMAFGLLLVLLTAQEDWGRWLIASSILGVAAYSLVRLGTHRADHR